MKPVNIQSLLSTRCLSMCGGIPQKIYDEYLIYLYGSRESPLKEHEWSCLYSLVQYLGGQFDGFYLNYTIPQIGKEFDIIRLGVVDGKEVLVNIELKTEANEEDIKRQLFRNSYYLKFTQRKLFLYTFVESTKTLYQLREQELIQLEEPSELQKLLYRLEGDTTTDLDTLFDPSHYLISPFNTTEQFLSQEYFLTQNQEKIKNGILKYLGSSESVFSSITGAAGTGKTLLIYDIANSVIKQGKRVLILHCGPLNDGQKLLIENHNWDIECTKSIRSVNQDDFDLIIIDEAQRMKPGQWDRVVRFNTKCIFSFDSYQYLNSSEKKNNIGEKIFKLSNPYNYTLTEKVRSNKDIVGFLKQLFDKNKNFAIRSKISHHIEIHYFCSVEDLKVFQTIRANIGWVIPKYTPSKHGQFYYQSYATNTILTPHRIIGQEYDNILAIVDHTFSYDDKGRLIAKAINSSDTYSLERMFYQIVSRTRKKLCIAILNNEEVFSRCLEILNRDK